MRDITNPGGDGWSGPPEVVRQRVSIDVKSEADMSNTLNQMRCCEAQSAARHRSAARYFRRWRSAGSCVGSGAMLFLLPKCPVCIAAYLAVWTGAGIAAPIAGHLRFAMAAIFVVSFAFLLTRRLVARPNAGRQRWIV
jgi:hypothetical protein